VLPHRDFRLPRGVLLALWVASLGILLAGLGMPVVQRTQEARVLETAREMLESRGWNQWMIPVLNGQVRMHKPPGAYWAAAAGFKLFGVNEFGGRFFFAVAGWLTIGLSYQFGRKLIYESAGLFAAGMLLGSFMFFRYFRLAETDALATLSVTAAIYLLWRGAFATGGRSVLRFQLAGVMIGLSVLAKGPQAAFPLIFFIAWVVLERKWAALARFLTSGALLTAIVVGGWWFAVIWKSPYAHILKDELWVATGGEDHKRPFYIYFPLVLTAPLPWTGVLVLGLVRAVARWRAEPAPPLLLVWVLTIFVPLCFLGNKQVHYLLPIAPAAALVGAYGIHRGLVGDARERAAARWVMGITLAVSLLAPAGIIYYARHQRGALQTLDLVLAVLVLAAGVGAVSLLRRQGLAAGVIGYAAGVALAFAVTFGRFLPSLVWVDHRTIASDLRGKWGDGPYVFYGKNLSLPLVWNLRQTIEPVQTREELESVLARSPQTVVIAQTKNDVSPPPVPAGLVEAAIYRAGDEGMTFRIYVVGDLE
jgi:4-amino-4-deoxy-L-arabinose transferase